MHPYLRQAVAQAHAEELIRLASPRRRLVRVDVRVRRPKVAVVRRTARPAAAHR